jgi:putative ABC transport system ATP-binding protein
MSALVEIRNLSKIYDRGKQKIEVLHHVQLDIEAGDFMALMGPSGSGKTTLLNLIGGLDSPTDGSITIGGQRIDRARRTSASCSSSTTCCRCSRRAGTSSCRCC